MSYSDYLENTLNIVDDGWHIGHGSVPIRREAGENEHDHPAAVNIGCGPGMDVEIDSPTERQTFAVAAWWTTIVAKAAINSVVSRLLLRTRQGETVNSNTVMQLSKDADDFILEGAKREISLRCLSTQFFENVMCICCTKLFGDSQLVSDENSQEQSQPCRLLDEQRDCDESRFESMCRNSDGHQGRLIAEEFIQNVVDACSVSSLLAADDFLTTPTEGSKSGPRQTPIMLVADEGTVEKKTDGQFEQGAPEVTISTSSRCASINSFHRGDGDDVTLDVSFSPIERMNIIKANDCVGHLVPRSPRSESAGLVEYNTNTCRTTSGRDHVPPPQEHEGSTIGLLSYTLDDIEDYDGGISIATNTTAMEPLLGADRPIASVVEHSPKRGVSLSRKRQRLGTYVRITHVPAASTAVGTSNVQPSQSAAIRMESRNEVSCRNLRQQVTGGGGGISGGRPRTGIQAGIIGRDAAIRGKRPAENTTVNAEQRTQHQHQHKWNECNREESVKTVPVTKPQEISISNQRHHATADKGSGNVSVGREHAPRSLPRLHETISPQRLGRENTDKGLEDGFSSGDRTLRPESPQTRQVIGRLVGSNSAGSADQTERATTLPSRIIDHSRNR